MVNWVDAGNLSQLNAEFSSSQMTIGHFAGHCGVDLPHNVDSLRKLNENADFAKK